MWSAVPFSICPQCQYELAPALRSQAHFCPVCRFPLLLLAGKYQLRALLGQGGSGKVYLAHHVGLYEANERVIKILDDRYMTTAQIERFFREVQITARVSLSNEHIVRIYDDFGHEPNLGYYYVMEYLQGRSLGQAIREEGALPLSKALPWFEQLCQAMATAHRAGIIHRDLKPENILLIPRTSSDEHVKVIDFGIAKPTARSHEISEHIVGTPLYMSPEQCLGQALDSRSDIYTMGLILYEMITGQHPFELLNLAAEEDLLTVIYAQIHELPRPISVHWPELGISSDVEIVIHTALQKNPAHRHASVESFWQELLYALPNMQVSSAFSNSLASRTQVAPSFSSSMMPRTEVSPAFASAAFSSGLASRTQVAPAFSGGIACMQSSDLASVGQATAWSLPPFSVAPQTQPGSSTDTAANTAANAGWSNTLPAVVPALPSAESWPELPVVPAVTGNLSALHLPANRFVGRTDAWQNLDGLWQTGSRIVTLLGCGGIGKTRLAQEYGYQGRMQQSWPGGVWYCDLSAVGSLGEFLESLIQTLHIQFPTESTLHGTLRAVGSAIQSYGPSLWILDHFDALVRLTHDIFSSWFLLAPQARFLVTSRQRLSLPEEQVIELAPLPVDVSIELFVDRASSAAVFHEPAKNPMILDMVQWLEGLPLALEIAAAQLHGMDIAALHSRLFQSIEQYNRSDRQDDHAYLPHDDLFQVWATLDGSWNMLSSAEQEVFAQCSVFQGGFSVQAAEQIIQGQYWPEGPAISNMLSVLRDRSLLRFHPASGTGQTLRYDMYPMARQHAAQKLEQMGQTAQVQHRHARVYLSWTQQHIAQGEWTESQDQIAPLFLEKENLRLIVQRYRQTQPELALQAHLVLYPVLITQEGTEHYLEQLHQILTTGGVISSSLRVEALQVQAECMRRLGYHEKAQQILENALVMAYARDNPQTKAKILNRLGNIFRIQGYLTQAETMHKEALVLYREQQDWHGTGVALGLLGNVYRIQGRLEDSECLLREALQIHRQGKDRRSEAVALGQLGNLYRTQGRLDDALDTYETALVLQREQGNLRGECITLSNIGMVKRKQGLLLAAEQSYQQLMILYRDMEDRRGESIVLDQMGMLLQLRGVFTEAITFHSQALSLYQQLHDRRGEGYCLHNLARIFRVQEQWQVAQSYLEQAIHIHQHIEDVGGVGIGFYQLGLLLLEQGSHEQAHHFLDTALQHLRKHQIQEQEGDILLMLSLLHHEQGDLPAALQYVQESLQLAIKQGDQVLETISVSTLIAVAAALEKFEKAYGAFTHTKKLCEQQNNPTLVVGWNIDSAHLDLALAQHAQFQQQVQVASQYRDTAVQKWNDAYRQLLHGFPTHTDPSVVSFSAHSSVAATDHLRLSLRRLQKALFFPQSSSS